MPRTHRLFRRAMNRSGLSVTSPRSKSRAISRRSAWAPQRRSARPTARPGARCGPPRSAALRPVSARRRSEVLRPPARRISARCAATSLAPGPVGLHPAWEVPPGQDPRRPCRACRASSRKGPLRFTQSGTAVNALRRRGFFAGMHDSSARVVSAGCPRPRQPRPQNGPPGSLPMPAVDRKTDLGHDPSHTLVGPVRQAPFRGFPRDRPKGRPLAFHWRGSNRSQAA